MTDQTTPPADAGPTGATQDARKFGQNAGQTSAPQKTPPEALTLRAAPRRIVRFRRSIVIGGAAAGALAIAGLAWMALGPKTLQIVRAVDDKPVSDRRPPAEAVAGLPGDYSRMTPQTPILGAPLPGDLGRPILDRQRELERLGADDNANEATGRPLTPTEQAAQAERQRIAAQAGQAREAGVLVQTAARADMAVPATAGGVQAGDGATGSGAGVSNTDGRLSLDPERDQNNQQRKIDFLRQPATGGIYNPHALQSPASPYQVMAGSVIAASLLTGLNSDLPGLVTAQVTENVYDSVTGRFLLIPQGSRLIGSYDSVVAFGQRRALVVWQRIILPDGSSVEIDNLPATDAAGYAGLADKVDYHTWQLLKGVALSTLLGVGTELSVSSESDLVRAIRQSTQQSAAQAGQQIVSKNLNIQPTITVRPGWPLRIVLHRDLVLLAYAGSK